MGRQSRRHLYLRRMEGLCQPDIRPGGLQSRRKARQGQIRDGAKSRRCLGRCRFRILRREPGRQGYAQGVCREAERIHHAFRRERRLSRRGRRIKRRLPPRVRRGRSRGHGIGFRRLRQQLRPATWSRGGARTEAVKYLLYHLITGIVARTSATCQVWFGTPLTCATCDEAWIMGAIDSSRRADMGWDALILSSWAPSVRFARACPCRYRWQWIR